MPRRYPIIQFPNPPLIAAIAAAALARITDRATAQKAALASQLALLVWAYQEVVSGTNWFRRLLGLAGGASSVIALARLIAAARAE